ncbi:MAG: CBS domain-containing protein [Candidatus Levybacteria bacterium]|nr:CBS domain-containing protein [Candidatus Levybacteria bacterium]
MIYFSQLVNKNIYFNKKIFGKIIDAAVFENYPMPSLSKIAIKKNNKKVTITPEAINFSHKFPILKSAHAPLLPFDEKDFYLKEDLLDKQVIDIDGKRLVRVNDIILESNGELKVIGIDIGLSGILRRLGVGKLAKLKDRVLPWQMIEAFDYETGNIKIKLTQNKLNSLHPAELADILEELGTKERLGIIEVLNPDTAAKAIEEANPETQEAILEQLPTSPLKTIVEKMHLSEFADIFYKINPLRIREILGLLGIEKARRVEKLLDFGMDTAGGIMTLDFYTVSGDKTAKEILIELSNLSHKPEAILITNGHEKLIGTLLTKDLVNCDQLSVVKDIVSDRKFTYANIDFSQILRIFSQYHLRLLPVVDKEKKPIGVISIDSVLGNIEERQEENESI